jgi:hypothetical protein
MSVRRWDTRVMLRETKDPDLTGTTIETCIRLMSRWGKEGVVETEKDGFVLVDRSALEVLTRG